MITFLNDHFWALWWLAIIVATSLPKVIVIGRRK
jgi:hypothetical protein